MRAPARFIAAVPALAAVVWSCAQVINAGTAGAIVQDSFREMNAWAATRREPSPETWRSVHDELLLARNLVPQEPSVRELLGVLDIRGGPGQEALGEATEQLASAIELRPTSPYSWANFATARYRLGDTGKEFQAALVRAVELGPYEPEVHRTAAFLGLAVWDDVNPSARAAIARAIAAGTKRNPLEMLQIGERRGRLDLVCGHVAGSSRRIGSKWAEICQSLEATS